MEKIKVNKKYFIDIDFFIIMKVCDWGSDLFFLFGSAGDVLFSLEVNQVFFLIYSLTIPLYKPKEKADITKEN